MVLMLLAQAAQEGVPAVVQAQLQASPWNPALITALFAGITTLVGAVTGMIIQLRAIYKDGEAREKKSVERAAKSESAVQEVHDLVNAGNSALLEEIARLKRRVAVISGKDEDLIEADAADHNVSEKSRITDAATEKREQAHADQAALTAQRLANKDGGK